MEYAAAIIDKRETILMVLYHGLVPVGLWYLIFIKRGGESLSREVSVKPEELTAGAAISNSVDVQPRPEPPSWAEFIVGLCVKKRYRNGLLQSLEEDFIKDIASGRSLRRARLRYWSAALRSVGPQLWAAIKRIGFIGAATEFAHRFFG
jgi:hypothetical protein